MKTLEELSNKLNEEIKTYCLENKKIIHKITIDPELTVFEIWTVGEGININKHVFQSGNKIDEK